MSAPQATPVKAIEAHEVHRYYPRLLGLRKDMVLRGLDLEVESGEILGLIGPNGCGKSTFLRLIAGVDRPSKGSLSVFGLPARHDRALANTGYLPEDSPFPAELSALRALELLGSLQRMKRSELRPRAEEMLERVGLLPFKKRRLSSFSRGMSRRFGLAQAWLHQPDLILLDEPTAGLDAQGFDVLDDLLSEARSRGSTVVLSSHILSDLSDYCTRLAVLLDGRIAASGAPTELLSDEGRMRVEIDGLAEDAELDQWVLAHGGKIVRREAGTRTLLELYRRHSTG